MDDLTKSFQKKHEQLIKQEKEIKEKLENEVTKAKEKLENFLSLSNSMIKINEKINQGIKKLQKEEKNIIKILSYVSKINKNKKDMNKLLQQQMISLHFIYQEEQSNIKYNEYYFNGISILNKIEYKDISYNNINLSWNIDKIKINEELLKYIVEIRKNKEQFNKVYEGKNTFCSINNLEYDTNYEIRICSIYNEIIGPWTEIQNIKTKNFDSIILKDLDRKNEFLKKMLEWTGYKNIELIYRGSRDGMTSYNFHNNCDNKGPTITLYKTKQKTIFGGYNSDNWSSDSNWHNPSNCFIFTLINIYNTNPTKFPFKNNNTYATYHGPNHGPCFGYGYDISANCKDFLNNSFQTNFPYDYEDTLGKGKSIFTGNLNNNITSYNLLEVEVFKLLK